jgi:hypothetical protein
MGATRRQHSAIRPAGSDNVLVFGGAGGLRSAEVYVSAENRFAPAEETNASADSRDRVTVAMLDDAGNPTEVRFFLLKPSKTAPIR